MGWDLSLSERKSNKGRTPGARTLWKSFRLVGGESDRFPRSSTAELAIEHRSSSGYVELTISRIQEMHASWEPAAWGVLRSLKIEKAEIMERDRMLPALMIVVNCPRRKSSAVSNAWLSIGETICQSKKGEATCSLLGGYKSRMSTVAPKQIVRVRTQTVLKTAGTWSSSATRFLQIDAIQKKSMIACC